MYKGSKFYHGINFVYSDLDLICVQKLYTFLFKTSCYSLRRRYQHQNPQRNYIIIENNELL